MTASVRRVLWAAAAVIAVAFLVVGSTRTAEPRTQQDRIDAISKRLACPTCQGESIYVSRAPAAESVRAEIARQVARAQRTDDEIIDITPDPQPPVRNAKPAEISKLLMGETLDDTLPKAAHDDFIAQMDAAA